MKVTLEVHGGLAATFDRRPPRVLDTRTLPEDAAAELARLVAAAAPEPEPEGPGLARDAMTYTITVQDGATSAVLTRSDPTMTAAFATLLTWLEKHFA